MNSSLPSADSSQKPSRRGFFFGAAAVSAAAVAATATRGVVPVTEVAVVPMPERGGGYSASAHVQQYYQTARL
jgi:hypothetical protein